MNTLVLLHGFCENQHLWKHIRSLLTDVEDVLALDLPGFGTNINSAHSITEMAEDIYLQLETKGCDNVIVVGHSMGGYVALQLAQKYPKLVKGLGLFHSTSLSDADEKKINRDKVVAHISSFGKHQYLKSMTNSLLSEAHLKDESMVNKAYSLIEGASTEGMINALEAMRDRPSSLNFISETNLPILWIIGRQDSFFDVNSQLNEVSKCNRVCVHILENAGHLGMVESPNESAKIINGFVKWVNNYSAVFSSETGDSTTDSSVDD